MTVSSKPTLKQVIAEFKGPSNLRAYYRGGKYVPDTSANKKISTSVSGLALSQFAGARAAVPLTGVEARSVFDSVPAGSAQGSSTATPVGGTAPFKYNWTHVSGAAAIIAANTNKATCIFSFSGRGTQRATWKVTVTDATGTSKSASISVTLTVGVPT